MHRECTCICQDGGFSCPVWFCMQAYDECNGPAVMVEFLAGCGDSKLLEAGLHHMHRACSASALLCGIWGAQGSMELALAVAADTTWPYRVRRSALLLVSVLCRGSSESARHFLLLEVCAGCYQAVCLYVCPSCLSVCRLSVGLSACDCLQVGLALPAMYYMSQTGCLCWHSIMYALQ